MTSLIAAFSMPCSRFPREAFVPASRQALAYLDIDLDVSEGGAKRFLIKPQLTGKLLQAAEIGEGDNVLVVGCATGYLAALTAKLARQVTATECDSALAAKARDAFAAMGLANVSCKAAACAEGDPAAAPYDVIILNGATEVTPDGLLGPAQGGRAAVGRRGRIAAVAGRECDPHARRIRSSAVVRCGRPGASRAGTGRRLRLLTAQTLLKSRSESEVWPGCCT